MSQPLNTTHERSTSTQHLVIRASAGSGKTYALSNRYLKLLYQGAGAHTILATTFTRKAAGEILGRVLIRLAAAAVDDQGAAKLGLDLKVPQLSLQDTQRMLAHLTNMLHRVSISTIDSFFNRMVQCFRHELRVPSGCQLVADDDPIASLLRRQAIDALLTEEDPRVLLDLLRRLHHDAAKRSVTQAIDRIVMALYDVFRQTDPSAWSVSIHLPLEDELESFPPLARGMEKRGPADEIQSSHLAPLDEIPSRAGRLLCDTSLTEALGRLRAISQHMQSDRRWAVVLRNAVDNAMSGNWPAFITGGLVAKIVAGDLTYRHEPIPTTVSDAYAPLIEHARGVLLRRLANRTGAMFDLLRRFDEHYRCLRYENQILLFSDLAWKLAHELPALGANRLDDVYHRLDSQVSHLLLDEFQDTSIEQWQVLKPFAREILRRDRSQPGRTFFCVGDVKQAIYGWRGGCAEIFAQLEQDLQLSPATGHTLSKSYRSSPIVLEAINRVFVALGRPNSLLAGYPEAFRQWQEEFRPHEAHYEYYPGYVELITSTVAGAADSHAEMHAGKSQHDDFVAHQVADLAHHHPGRSIGVLVSTNAKVKQLIYLLRRLEVVASGEGGTPVTDDPAVNVILSALTLSDHPGHSAASFHVLHSPLASILALHSTRRLHVSAVARKIRQMLAHDGYAKCIARWMSQLAPHCDQRSISRLTQLVQLAGDYKPSGQRRIRDFVDFVSATTVEESTTAPVRVMTIHKAKGLEFDVVVLGELERIPAHRDLLVWTHRSVPTEAPMAVFATVDKRHRKLFEKAVPQLGRAHRQEVDRRIRDDLCALYVAMTRARFALHLIVEPLRQNASGRTGRRGVDNLCYAALLRQALAREDESFEGGQTLYAHGDCNWSDAELAPPTPTVADPRQDKPKASPLPNDNSHVERSTRHGLEKRTHKQRRSWPRIRPSGAATGESVQINELLKIEPSSWSLRGTVIHAFFQSISWLGPQLDEGHIGSTAFPTDERLLSEACQAVPGQDDRLLRELLGEFKQMIRQPITRQALARPDGEVTLWRERPFAVYLEPPHVPTFGLVQGIFDRVVVHYDESSRARSASLLDFKTDRLSSEASARLLKSYGRQIELYRTALAQMLNLDHGSVDASLLFVATGERIKL